MKHLNKSTFGNILWFFFPRKKVGRIVSVLSYNCLYNLNFGLLVSDISVLEDKMIKILDKSKWQNDLFGRFGKNALLLHKLNFMLSVANMTSQHSPTVACCSDIGSKYLTNEGLFKTKQIDIK